MHRVKYFILAFVLGLTLFLPIVPYYRSTTIACSITVCLKDVRFGRSIVQILPIVFKNITMDSQKSLLNEHVNSNWKTYTSVVANFSLKIPPDWTLLDIPYSVDCKICVKNITISVKSGENRPALSIIVNKDDKVKNLNDYINLYVNGNAAISKIQHTTLDGVEALSFVFSGITAPIPLKTYVLVHNGYYYLVQYHESARTFDQILSTFKFLEITPTPTCRPRPACLDSTPKCLIPETSDMCPSGR